MERICQFFVFVYSRCCHYVGATREEGRGGEGRQREGGEDLSGFFYSRPLLSLRRNEGGGGGEREKRNRESGEDFSIFFYYSRMRVGRSRRYCATPG